MIPVITVAAGDVVGSEVLAALDAGAHGVAVQERAARSMDAERLSALLQPGCGIGVVLPRAVSPAHSSITGPSSVVDGSAADISTDIDASSDHSAPAARAAALSADVLRRTPIDPETTVADLIVGALRTARRNGARVVREPTWTVTRAGASELEPVDGHRPEMLLVLGNLPVSGLRSDDLLVRSLIEDLVDVAPASRLTVAALDSFMAGGGITDLEQQGIVVATGPRDWRHWCAQRWGRFDQIVVAAAAMRSPVRRWVEQTQPQARRVLLIDALPARGAQALRPVCPADELEGLEHVTGVLEDHFADWLRWSDLAICTSARDAELVRGLARGCAAAHIPPPTPGHAAGGARRSGVALIAVDGHDAAAANEESVLTAEAWVLGRLRRSHPEVGVTVLTDAPTPRLSALAASAGWRILPSSRGREVLATSKVALALHQFGTGGPAVVRAAIGAGTPVIASPHAASGLDPEELAALLVCGTAEDASERVRRLANDEAAWSAAERAVTDHRATARGSAARRAALRPALASVGVELGGARRWPNVATLPLATRRPHVPMPLLRPMAPGLGAPRAEQAAAGPEDLSADERYRRWVRRHGPGNPAVLAGIRSTCEHLRHLPTFSIVVPVYNTDPVMLREAVSSVHEQLYDRWELCLADDHSTDPQTIEALAEVEGWGRATIVRLPENGGIVAATNAALATARGDHIVFLDHDDLLKPHALAQVARWLDADPDLDVIYSDEDKLGPDGQLGSPHCKPDWSPDLLMSVNYINHLTVVRRSLVEEVGGLRPGYDGSQDYDLLLRITERTDRIAHIPEPLYTWRVIPGSAAERADAKPYALTAAKRALNDALRRRGMAGSVTDTPLPTIYRTRYDVPGRPLVSIVIPTRDRLDLLGACVRSVFERSTYGNYEVVVIDNGSREGSTLEWLADSPVRVIRYPYRFNYARQVNLAASLIESDALLFLNNDTEVISPDWIEALLEHAMRPEVGAVGGRLYYRDGRVQHEGILVGVGGWAWNVDHRDYFARGNMVRDVSAVTGACTMIRPTVYARVGGNDEQLRIAYNDVDLCLRVRQAGYRIVYTPYAELYHREGASRRGWEHDEDGPLFGARWRPRELTDPYYSPMFERDRPFVIVS